MNKKERKITHPWIFVFCATGHFCVVYVCDVLGCPAHSEISLVQSSPHSFMLNIRHVLLGCDYGNSGWDTVFVFLFLCFLMGTC